MLIRSVFLKLKTKYVVIVVVFCLAVKIFGILTHLFEQDYYTSFQYPYEGDIHMSVLQLRYNQTPDIRPINSYDYQYTLNPLQKCKQDEGAVPLRLVFVIKSAPENFNRRIAIRNTWGYEHRFSDVEIRTVFILGIKSNEQLQYKVHEESTKFKDIVQANFIDAYFNNTIKTMMGFKWIISFCSSSKFYMFVDDDYYVSTKNVLRFTRNPVQYPQYLQDTSNHKRKRKPQLPDFELPDDVKLYSGYVFFSSPHRHFPSKWYVSLEEYPYHLWPPYVTAGAYVLSQEAMLEMYYTSFYTKHFRFDDVYLGLLAKKAGIEPFHCDNFYFYKQQYSPENYQFTVASHGYESTLELIKVWTEAKSLGNA